MNKMIKLAQETRNLGIESKKLWNKCLAKMMPEMDGLDDEMTLMLRDSLKLMNTAFEYIELEADVLEEQAKENDELRKKLDEILKEVKKK